MFTDPQHRETQKDEVNKHADICWQLSRWPAWMDHVTAFNKCRCSQEIMGRVCGLHKLRVLGPPLTSTQATSGTCWAEISWNITTFKSLTWAPFAIFRIAGGRLHAISIYFSSRGWWSTAHWHLRLAWWLHKHRLVAKRTRSKRNVSCRHWFGMLKTLILFPQIMFWDHQDQKEKAFQTKDQKGSQLNWMENDGKKTAPQHLLVICRGWRKTWPTKI